MAVANRITALVPIFFGHLAGIGNTDRFDVKQGVELVWRELSGQARAAALRREVRFRLPEVRRAIDGSTPGGAPAVAAVDAIDALTDEAIDDRTRLRRVLRSAVDVALALDDLEVAPPGGQPTWITFELRGQADLFALRPGSPGAAAPQVVADLRLRSGEESMAYRNAMKTLLRSRSR